MGAHLEALCLSQQIGEKKTVEPLFPLEAEFTRPLWNFGNTSFAFVQSEEAALKNSIVLTYRFGGLLFHSLLFSSLLVSSHLVSSFLFFLQSHGCPIDGWKRSLG